jgi:hypothetical protein
MCQIVRAPVWHSVRQSCRFCLTEKWLCEWLFFFYIFQLYKNKDSKSVTGEVENCLLAVLLSNIVLTKFIKKWRNVVLNFFLWLPSQKTLFKVLTILKTAGRVPFVSSIMIMAPTLMFLQIWKTPSCSPLQHSPHKIHQHLCLNSQITVLFVLEFLTPPDHHHVHYFAVIMLAVVTCDLHVSRSATAEILKFAQPEINLFWFFKFGETLASVP